MCVCNRGLFTVSRERGQREELQLVCAGPHPQHYKVYYTFLLLSF